MQWEVGKGGGGGRGGGNETFKDNGWDDLSLWHVCWKEKEIMFFLPSPSLPPSLPPFLPPSLPPSLASLDKICSSWGPRQRAKTIFSYVHLSDASSSSGNLAWVLHTKHKQVIYAYIHMSTSFINLSYIVPVVCTSPKFIVRKTFLSDGDDSIIETLY